MYMATEFTTALTVAVPMGTHTVTLGPYTCTKTTIATDVTNNTRSTRPWVLVVKSWPSKRLKEGKDTAWRTLRHGRCFLQQTLTVLVPVNPKCLQKGH